MDVEETFTQCDASTTAITKSCTICDWEIALSLVFLYHRVLNLCRCATPHFLLIIICDEAVQVGSGAIACCLFQSQIILISCGLTRVV